MEWKDIGYGCYKLEVGKMTNVFIERYDRSYRVSVNEVVLTRRVQDIDEAKALGVRAARELLQSSLDNLIMFQGETK